MAVERRKRKVHGMSTRPVYAVWRAMRARCELPTNRSYPDYGGRGIVVCDRWQHFQEFYADMGDPAPGMTLDRGATALHALTAYAPEPDAPAEPTGPKPAQHPLPWRIVDGEIVDANGVWINLADPKIAESVVFAVNQHDVLHNRVTALTTAGRAADAAYRGSERGPAIRNLSDVIARY